MAKKKSTYIVTSHSLVPKHMKLSQKDKKELLTRLSITVKELPKISVKDAAIRSLNVQVGDVIKIQRSSPTAGSAAYYRGVVNE